MKGLLREAHVAHEARDMRDDARGLDPPDCLDGPMRRRRRRRHGVPQFGPAAFGSMWTSSQMCPSRSSKPCPYMNP
jgi:hypothetical protein